MSTATVEAPTTAADVKPAKRGRQGKQRNAETWGQVSRLASGAWRAAYIGPDHQRHTPGCSYATKDAARAWLRDERRLVDDLANWTSPADRRAAAKRQSVTLAAWVDQWLDRTDLRPLSLVDYRQSLRLRILPALGSLPLAKIDRKKVLEWWHGLDVKAHPTACSKAYGTLRAMMNAAKDAGLIDTNPCTRIKGAGKPSNRRSIDPLTPAQVLAVADEMPPRWHLGVLLGAWCALRSGEVRDLRRADIDLQGGTVSVSHAAIEHDGIIESTAPKTDAGRRVVSIPAAIMPDVKAHIATYAALGNPLLFQRPDGRPVASVAWMRAFRKACGAAGVSQSFVFHDLRHTGLTYFALAGGSLAELQRRAGHTTPAMAMRYQEVAKDHLSEVVDNLSAIIETGRLAQ